MTMWLLMPILSLKKLTTKYEHIIFTISKLQTLGNRFANIKGLEIQLERTRYYKK